MEFENEMENVLDFSENVILPHLMLQNHPQGQLLMWLFVTTKSKIAYWDNKFLSIH